MTVTRTQQERRDETRGKLLDATIESLLDAGYAGDDHPPGGRAGRRVRRRA